MMKSWRNRHRRLESKKKVSELQVADILTKPLGKERFELLREKLSVCNVNEKLRFRESVRK